MWQAASIALSLALVKFSSRLMMQIFLGATQTRVFEQISVTYYIRTLQGLEYNEKTTSTSLKLTMNGKIHHVMLMALFLVSFERTDSASRVYVEIQY
jgi:hypothetical protein